MKKNVFLYLFIFFSHFLSGQNYIANVEHFNIENGLSHNQINWIHKDQRGIMWIGTFNGINRYDGQEFNYVAEADFAHVINGLLLEDRDGDLWLRKHQNKNELFFFNIITEKVKTFEEKFGSNPPFKSTDFKTTKILSDSSIVVHLHSGKTINLPNFKKALSSVDNETNKDLVLDISQPTLKIFHANQPDVSIVTQSDGNSAIGRIDCLIKDGDIFWVGSYYGLFKIKLAINPFKKALNIEPASLRSCRGIAEDNDGNIYVVKHGPILNIKDGSSIGNRKFGKSILEIFFDKQENWWFDADDGRDNNGIIIRANFKTGTHQIFGFEDILFGQNWSFYQDKNDRIWCGTSFGLTYYEEGFSNFKKFKNNNEFQELEKNTVYEFYEDRNGLLWLATSGGLYQLDLEDGITARYWNGGTPESFLPVNDLRHIHRDTAGIFWLATREGLIRWDKEKSESRLFTIHDGLPSNILNAVYEDDFGFLWVSSENGIIQFEKSTFQVKIYQSDDGITNPEFNRISHYKDGKGNIYFGSMNGVTYFHPKDFVEIFNRPIDIPIVMTECSVFSEETKQQENRIEYFYKNKKLTIAPSDKYLSLQFALLDYGNSKGLKYLYEIDGEQWKISKDNSINISSLPYGNHTLVVKGRTSSGLFSNQTLSIPIEVLKPFYLQWWFIGLCIAALAFGIFMYQKRRTQKLIEQKEVLENTVQERTQTIQLQAEELNQLNKAKSKFMANISHEFRTPLTLVLNTLNSKIIKSESNGNGQGKTFTYPEMDVEIMSRNAHRLQQLIDQLLDLSKMEAGKMTLRASKNDFYDYLKNLVLSFQPLAKNKNITLTFSSDLTQCELYFDRDKMDKITYNLLGNAIKFTPENKNVDVLLEKQNDAIIFKIIDAGIGIPKEEIPFIFDRFYRGDLKDEFAYEGTGLGLALVNDFVEIHHGKIEVESEQGLGTSFTIHLPMGDAHLQPEEIIISKDESLLSKQSKVGNIILDSPLELKHDEEKPILLIIEDNEDLLYHHQQNFKNDFQLFLAKDGEEGIKLATEYLPDLIVCDVMMPKKNGYEVCQHLKLDEKTNHIPIILLTAKAEQAEKMEGLMVGADDYLTKPYQQKELEIRIKNLLTLQKHLQKKFKLQIQNSKKSSAKTPTVKTPQERFIEKCEKIVEENYSNPNFGVDEWGKALYLSRPQLFRKVKTVLGATPMQFLRNYRLEKAKELLSKNVGNGSEIAYMIGFKNPNYFFKCFKDEYGITVGDFIKT